MLTAKYIEDLVEATKVPNDLKFLDDIGFSAFVREFRTVTIKTPRQSGKTRAVKEFVYDKSAFLINGSSPGTVMGSNKFRGIRPEGLKYQYIVVDECLNVDQKMLMDFIIELQIANLLTKDFRLIIVGT